MSFLNNKIGQMVFNIYTIGFEDAGTGEDSKKKEELLKFVPKKLPLFTKQVFEEVVCTAYVWGWQDKKNNLPKKSLEEINRSVAKGIEKGKKTRLK